MVNVLDIFLERRMIVLVLSDFKLGNIVNIFLLLL